MNSTNDMNKTNDLKKIALIINASNFERQKNIIKPLHRKLSEMGNYALYVFTNYGLFLEDTPYSRGEASIYALLDVFSFDGCILEGNVGNQKMLTAFADKLRERNIPFVTLHFSVDNAPFLVPNVYPAACQLLRHLIEEHHCLKINLATSDTDDILTRQSLQAYHDTLKEYGIKPESKRIVRMPVSISNGRSLYHTFMERRTDDAQAVLCLHDVYAIGLCLELEAHGLHVPDDVLLASLNRSTNSVVFRPDITGSDRSDREIAEQACVLLEQMIEGRAVPHQNYLSGNIHYGQSCGCQNAQSDSLSEQYQELVLAKIEAGNQIGRMMQYNDSLEEMDSLDELGHNVKTMLEGISCSEFLFCLNQSALKYIVNENASPPRKPDSPFDETMIAIAGSTKRSGELSDYPFPLQELVPIPAESGDILLFLPVHHKEQIYGYMVFVNEYLPIDIYNYRICHESIGSSIENLHRQMLLQSSIRELDELHMQDALTGLYNRFAWNRFHKKYIQENKYCVVMMDMDGMKKINDGFGHLAGNHAICIMADVIKFSISQNDLLIRYGGDEFQILSHNTDPGYWEHQRIVLNEKLAEHARQNKLPYQLGVSLGYAICDENCPLTFEECCQAADMAMYQNKKARKLS